MGANSRVAERKGERKGGTFANLQNCAHLVVLLLFKGLAMVMM